MMVKLFAVERREAKLAIDGNEMEKIGDSNGTTSRKSDAK